MGLVYAALGSFSEAVTCFQRALERKPDFADAYTNLGAALSAERKFEEAIACYAKLLELRPDDARTHFNLGNALRERGQLEQAAEAYGRAVTLRPDYAEAYNNLGNVLTDLRRPGEALRWYRRALEVRPAYAEAHNNLGNALADLGRLAEAIDCYRGALQLNHAYAEAQCNLGNALTDAGRLEEAIPWYRRAMELSPESPQAHSNLLAALQYRVGVTLPELAHAHAEYDRLHCLPLGAARQTHNRQAEPHRRLRLGLLSPDFYRHPVAYFLVRVLEGFDPSQVETVCYYDGLVDDDFTNRIKAAASAWRNVGSLTDEELADGIDADRIDLLIDLAGHTARNRLPVFARRPAPIQATWLGYEGTTGLRAMDYLLADQYLVPPGSERHYCEQILRLPDSYVCYDPPPGAPPVGRPPVLDRKDVTFASFNNPAKINRDVVTVWAAILRRMPSSRLVLQYRGLNDAAVEYRLRQMFGDEGIPVHRVEMRGHLGYSDYLASYQRIDLALDLGR